MINRALFFILIILSGVSAFADEADLGEQNFNHYFGPNDPLVLINRYNKQSVFKDEYDKKLYFNSKVENELFFLENFMDVELSIGLYCPDIAYKKAVPHYTYLSRLLFISYLFEGIRELEFTTRQMGFNNSCIPNWAQVFDSCRPKTHEMKLFLKNTKHILSEIEDVLVPFKLSTTVEKNKWKNDFKHSRLNNLSQYRLGQYCRNHGCLKMDSKFLNSSFDNICRKDVSFIKRLCSEKDKVYGGSNAVELYPLILGSRAIRSLGDKQYQAGCLRRFIKDNENREEAYPPLKEIVSFFYSKFEKNDSNYKRGRLFAVGALKEFLDKGLSNIFHDEVKQKKNTEKIPKKTINIIPKIEKITLPEFKRKKKIRRSKKKQVKKKKKQKLKSAFLLAANFRKKFDLEKVEVKMEKFKYDYTFTLEQEKHFGPLIKKFSSQKSLRDMYQLDKLGEKVAPIPLRFIKFLIDKEMHQGLYNIVSVIGDTFYVKNDIDPNINKLELIFMKNDQTTGFQWKITVKSPETKKSK